MEPSELFFCAVLLNLGFILGKLLTTRLGKSFWAQHDSAGEYWQLGTTTTALTASFAT